MPLSLYLTHQTNLDALGVDDRVSTGRLAGDRDEDADPLLDTCGRLIDALYDWWGQPPPIVPGPPRSGAASRSRAPRKQRFMMSGQLRDATALHAHLVPRAGFTVPNEWLAWRRQIRRRDTETTPHRLQWVHGGVLVPDLVSPYQLFLTGGHAAGEDKRCPSRRAANWTSMKSWPSRDPEKLARFQREAHLLASVNHPNVAIKLDGPVVTRRCRKRKRCDRKATEAGWGIGRTSVRSRDLEGRTGGKLLISRAEAL